MKKILNYSFLILVAFIGMFIPYIGLVLLGLMSLIIVSSIINGRIFCSKFCPHGFLFDNVLVKFSRNRQIPVIFKTTLLSIVYLLYFFSMFGSGLYKSYQSDNFLMSFSFVLSKIYLTTIIVSVTLGLIYKPRTFCQFCPQGTIQTIIDKISLKHKRTYVHIENKDSCVNCKLCNKSCPMTINVIDILKEEDKLDNRSCIQCGVCVDNCPKGIIKIA